MALLFYCDILGFNNSSGRAVKGNSKDGKSSPKCAALSVFSPDKKTKESQEQAGHYSIVYMNMLSFLNENPNS